MLIEGAGDGFGREFVFGVDGGRAVERLRKKRKKMGLEGCSRLCFLAGSGRRRKFKR